MTPFLQQIASLFYTKHGVDISRLAFVFPNQRAGIFFKKYLSEIADGPVFSPAILTIKDLFLKLSGKQEADRIGMLFSLYNIYGRISGSTETFDEFLYWGEMLLNDFDDIDKYQADAQRLFSNVTDLREIEHDFSFLNPKQIEAIRSFWSSFYPKGDSPNQREFLAVWQLLYELYTSFRTELAADGKGYEGMIFREVVEKSGEEQYRGLGYEQIVFVGLNALSVVEEKLLLKLQQMGIADFYWDYVSDKVIDPDNRASYFALKNREQFPSAHTLLPEEKTETSVEVIGIPSGVGQAKHVYALLQQIEQAGGLAGDNALRTAIVLPDEQLLVPLLNSIPESVQSINVTMGYPLSKTPVASLVDAILSLQRNIRLVDGQPRFYFRDVLPILNHRYVLATDYDVISQMVKDITQYNRIYIGHDDLNKTPLLGMLFHPVVETRELATYLIHLLMEINKRLDGELPVVDSEADETETGSQHLILNSQLDKEFIFHYYSAISRLKDVMEESGTEMRPETYSRLLKRAAEGVTIPFRGEPLSGLQVMGVLETRALDFDRVILLSMNDGVFPQRKVSNSFIPYNLRKGFGLPTYEHQDSIWAYHFYRLIHRAGSVALLYDTRTGGLQTGEVSRFIHQLTYHYEMPIRQKLVVFPVSSYKTPALQIEKTEEVMCKLRAFREGGDRAISASAINTYLDCPLKFYFSVVEEVREEDEVTEAVESSMFGSILHATLEDLYRPFCGKIVTADLLKIRRKDKKELTEMIARAFARHFFQTEAVRPLTGQHFLIGEMIRKYAEKVLERDGRLTPFIYIRSEKKMNDVFSLSNGSVVRLKGYIDRIDEVDGRFRIIDYKSGRGAPVFKSMESLFDKQEKERAKAVMQVFMYAWMFGRLPEAGEKGIQPGIYYMRTLFDSSFDSGVYIQTDKYKKEKMYDFNPYKESFEEEMRKCLDEVFDAVTPFIQTPTGKACAYCQFKAICGK